MNCVAPVISNTDITIAEKLAWLTHAPWKNSAVPVHLREVSSAIARSPKIRLMDTKVASGKENVKDDNVLDVTITAKSKNFSLEKVSAWDALLPAKNQCCASTLTIFEIYLRYTCSMATRIWPRALSFYCAVLPMLYASKTSKTATMMCLTRRVWKRSAGF